MAHDRAPSEQQGAGVLQRFVTGEKARWEEALPLDQLAPITFKMADWWVIFPNDNGGMSPTGCTCVASVV